MNPIGNPDLPGKTTSGWLNWLGLLTLGYNKTLVLNYDFAKGGATVNNSIVKSNNRPDFADQVAEFKGSIGSKPEYAKWTGDNALFAVWFGINDIGLSYAQGGENARIDKVHNSYFKNLDALYKAGARNFVILTIPRKSRTSCSYISTHQLTVLHSYRSDTVDERPIQRRQIDQRQEVLER